MMQVYTKSEKYLKNEGSSKQVNLEHIEREIKEMKETVSLMSQRVKNLKIFGQKIDINLSKIENGLMKNYSGT